MTSTVAPFTAGPRATTNDGVEIATYDLGGNGPDLLFCHATGFHGRVWLPVAARLQNDFRCVAFDFRGHGESDRAPGGDYRWDGFAQDVMAVLRAFDLVGARAVGHSGGGAAVVLAEQERPRTFRSLYCFEPVLPPDGATPVRGRANNMVEGTRRRREVFTSREEAYTNYAAKPPFSEFDPDAVRAYVDYGFEDLPDGSVRLRCRRDDEATIYENALGHQAFGRLSQVSCPVTLVCGGQQAHFGPEAIAAMAAQLPNAATEIMADLGHFGPMERPDEVAGSIRAAFHSMDDSTSSRSREEP